MSVSAPETKDKPAFVLRSRMTSVTVMRLFSTDFTVIEAQLREQIAQAPSFFRGALLTIDLEGVRDKDLDFAALVGLLRDAGLVPAAVRSGGADAIRTATELHLAALEWSETRTTAAPPEPAAASSNAAIASSDDVLSPPRPQGSNGAPSAPADTPAPTATVKSPTLVVTQLVRSGQQVYARGGDLMILNQVSPGAEVIADGHIHVYGALRGRALAGAQGDETARVLCKQMEAELIAVAGVYRVNEQLDERLRGQPVQAHLQDGNLVLEEL